MMAGRLTDYRVLSFDCYGTLIDWETGIWDALQPLIRASGRNDLQRAELLAGFGRHESRLESESPATAYPHILKGVHRALAEEFGMPSHPELDQAFGESLPAWPAFADSAPALRALKRRYRLVILSNVHRAGFAASARKLGVDFDAVYTAEDIGSYKPDPANFHYLLRRLEADFGIARERVLHTAQSLYHDHRPARDLGLATAWIDRQRLSRSGEWGTTAPVADRPEPDYLFFSMEELARAAAAPTAD